MKLTDNKLVLNPPPPTPQNKTAGRLFRALDGSPFSNKAFSSPGGVAENIITCKMIMSSSMQQFHYLASVYCLSFFFFFFLILCEVSQASAGKRACKPVWPVQSPGAVWPGRWASVLIPYPILSPSLIAVGHTVSVHIKRHERRRRRTRL